MLVNLDLTTPNGFDKYYYSNLQAEEGLLHSDQELYSTAGADTVEIVDSYGSNQTLFFEDFVISMTRMGNISPLTGTEAEIRMSCRRVNKEELISSSRSNKYWSSG